MWRWATLITALALLVGAAPVQAGKRGLCMRVTNPHGVAHRVVDVPRRAYPSLRTTRRGRVIVDANMQVAATWGPWVQFVVGEQRRKRTRVYITMHRLDRRRGRFCFTLRWH